MRILLSDLAEKLGVLLHGNGSIEISGVAGIREAGNGELTFLGHPKYEVFLATTGASAVIMPSARDGCRVPWLEASNPYLTFLDALKIFSHDRLGIQPGIHPTAILGQDVTVGRDASIGPYAVIGDHVSLGAEVVLMAGCFIGSDVAIGTGTFLYPNVVVREGTTIGDRVIIHSAAVIGDDGFGFIRDGAVIRKIPQIGKVEIGDDVEIGAGTTIDRATTGTTRIGRGSKIDNLVMIAHNVQIGENAILCAQVGISGSSTVGNDVLLGGQSGLVGHIEIGDRSKVGAQGGVTKSVPADTEVSGYPALPHPQARRIYAAMRYLPDLVRKVRDLNARVRALEEQPRGREEAP